jgi:hypothetical protein
VAAVIRKLVDALSLDIGFYGQLSLWLSSLLFIATASWSFFERPILNLKCLVPYPAGSRTCPLSLGTSMAPKSFVI